jgi:hypothetical protein
MFAIARSAWAALGSFATFYLSATFWGAFGI